MENENNEEQELEQQELVEQASEALEQQEIEEEMVQSEDVQEEPNPFGQMKQSDAYFLQKNYKALPLEALCLATDLPPDVVTEYISEYEDYLKRMGIAPDSQFGITISLNDEGVVGYTMVWPNAEKVNEILPLVGKLFYLMNKGELKESMIRFLVRFAQDNHKHLLVDKLLQEWRKHDEANKRPVVEADEVFST